MTGYLSGGKDGLSYNFSRNRGSHKGGRNRIIYATPKTKGINLTNKELKNTIKIQDFPEETIQPDEGIMGRITKPQNWHEAINDRNTLQSTYNDLAPGEDKENIKKLLNQQKMKINKMKSLEQGDEYEEEPRAKQKGNITEVYPRWTQNDIHDTNKARIKTEEKIRRGERIGEEMHETVKKTEQEKTRQHAIRKELTKKSIIEVQELYEKGQINGLQYQQALADIKKETAKAVVGTYSQMSNTKYAKEQSEKHALTMALAKEKGIIGQDYIKKIKEKREKEIERKKNIRKILKKELEEAIKTGDEVTIKDAKRNLERTHSENEKITFKDKLKSTLGFTKGTTIIEEQANKLYEKEKEKLTKGGVSEELAEEQAKFTANKWLRKQYKEADNYTWQPTHKPLVLNPNKGKSVKELFKLI